MVRAKPNASSLLLLPAQVENRNLAWMTPPTTEVEGVPEGKNDPAVMFRVALLNVRNETLRLFVLIVNKHYVQPSCKYDN